MRIGLHYSRQVKMEGIEHHNFFELLTIMSLLFISGIERNPGPASTASLCSSSSSTTFEENVIKEKFSVVHYNVQSIMNKLDIIETELRNFDVICLTETWLDTRTPDDLLVFKDFKLIELAIVIEESVYMFEIIFSLVGVMIWNYLILNVFGLKLKLIT